MQIRTTLQHMWAEVVERLADMWGRQIRYGQPPSEPDQPLATVTRGQFVHLMTNDVSNAIDRYEIVAQNIERTDRVIAEAGSSTTDSRVPLQLLEDFEQAKRQSADGYATLESILSDVRQALAVPGEPDP